MARLAVVAALVLTVAPVHAARTLPPAGKAALLRWLRAEAYRSWVAEPAVHPSTTAHGTHVRTFYAPGLAADLRTGRTVFRRGAAMVKELYDPDGVTRRGWAVMRKLGSRRRAGAWLFYETFDGTNRGAPYGRGLGLCAGCHAQGVDFLLSEFRP